MSSWYTTRIIKEVDIFQVSLNGTFSIANSQGTPRWVNPKFITNLREFKAKSYQFSTNIEIQKVSNTTYRVVSTQNSNIVSAIVDVLVIEGDDDINTLPPSRGNSWVTKLSLSPKSKQLRVYEVNERNGYSFTINDLRNRVPKIIIHPKKMSFVDGMYEFRFRITQKGNTFKVDILQKGSTDVGSFYEENSNKNRNIVIPKNTTMFSVTVFEATSYGKKYNGRLTKSGKSYYPNQVEPYKGASFSIFPNMTFTQAIYYIEGENIDGTYLYNPTPNDSTWGYLPPMFLYQYSTKSTKEIQTEGFEGYVGVVL